MKKYEYPERQIRAFFTKDFIRVYQAYSDAIADSALENGTFVSPPFSMTRMTWIKPSFLWMMYRSGWGMKDPGQKRILAVDLTHEGFKQLLDQGVLSHHDIKKNSSNIEEWKTKIKNSNVVIQWDPERDLLLNKLNHRTIQIGLRAKSVEDYCEKWIIKVSEVTELASSIKKLVDLSKIDEANSLLPLERELILN